MLETENSAYQSEIILPSRGLLYEGKIPEGKIKIRTMTTNEEKLIYSGKGNLPEKLNALIGRCCSLPQGMTASELLVSDRMFIIIKIRMASFPGIPYSVGLKCEDCKEQFSWPIELAELEVDYYEENQEVEPFAVELPSCKKQVGFRMLRGKDEEQIFRYGKQKKMKKKAKKVLEDETYNYRKAKRIVSIDGEEVDLATALAFVEGGMVSLDSLKLDQAFEKNDCGVDLGLYIECPYCDFGFERDMPFTQDFLRPESI